MQKHQINQGDIKEWAKNYQGELFDGILCDPHYELGFMGKSWDSSGIAFDSDMWADLLKLLKPGGHLLAFSGSRTYHRMAVAIEDAGFEIRDQLIWMYGSGFPKSLNIGKAVDKMQGNEREDLGFREDFRKRARKNGVESKDYVMAGGWKSTPDTVGKLDRGQTEWEGYGTALKPAHEPCVLARKPIEGTVANNVLKHGTGGLNIDGTRVGTADKIAEVSYQDVRNNSYAGGQAADRPRLEGRSYKQDPQGRFPSNLIHDGSDVVESVFPQTGKSSGGRIGNKGSMINTMGNAFEKGDPGFGDSGSASRYFYTAKASKRERNAGLDIDEFPLKHYLEANKMGGEKDTMLTGSGNPRDSRKQNHHPTVKPLSLTKYLATLIKPPTGGRLLVPFSGSGSEMIGALQAGWGYVEGVELTEEYIPIAEARIKYWLELKESEPIQGILL